MRKIAAITVILLLLFGVLAFWLDDDTPVQAAVTDSSAQTIVAEGRVSVRPDSRAVLSAEVAARLEQIHVDNLHPVKKGQVLAVQYNRDLHHRILQTEESYRMAEARYRELAAGYRDEEIDEAAAEVRRAESELELARRNEIRDRELMQEEVVAQSRYDTTVAERKKSEAMLAAAQERLKKYERGQRKETVAAAKAEMMSQKFALDSLKATYDKTFLRSPLDGIVVRRYLNASEFADVAMPVLEVANLSERIVEGEINELDAGRVRNGARVTVTSDAFPDQHFSGEIYEVSESLKRRSSDPENPAIIVDQKILPVKVKFLQQVPLKLGMRVDLKIQL